MVICYGREFVHITANAYMTPLSRPTSNECLESAARPTAPVREAEKTKLPQISIAIDPS